jgi:hypothetical protein
MSSILIFAEIQIQCWQKTTVIFKFKPLSNIKQGLWEAAMLDLQSETPTHVLAMLNFQMVYLEISKLNPADSWFWIEIGEKSKSNP